MLSFMGGESPERRGVNSIVLLLNRMRESWWLTKGLPGGTGTTTSPQAHVNAWAVLFPADLFKGCAFAWPFSFQAHGNHHRYGSLLNQPDGPDPTRTKHPVNPEVEYVSNGQANNRYCLRNVRR